MFAVQHLRVCVRLQHTQLVVTYHTLFGPKNNKNVGLFLN